ncbi:sialidase family protein [Clostridium sp. UBA6640]|uniref:sialidase family protein n=1 Tax=Clostridium sp. UBA6640 TaxID=1946370 RepID=UPI0025B96D0B|nr:sialidase family protein [Clostridium sp. UBA6640]
MKNIINITKKKAGASILCGALVLTLGTGKAFASDVDDSVQVKNENGAITYSIDGGQTWSEDAPEGFTGFESEDGKIEIRNANISKDDIGISVKIKLEDGVKLYSTDGGQTWSENVPEGVDAFIKEGGKIGIKNSSQIESGLFTSGQVKSEDGILSKGGNSFMVKNENGTRLYSEDGGQTWSENLPEGMSIEIK